MHHRVAEIADLSKIEALLRSNRLPADDCGDHIGNFFVIEEKGEIIGVGGFEACGRVGLVRSIAVKAAVRNRGIGRLIYQLIEQKAWDLGLLELYLLTESAKEYFQTLGFSVLERSRTPTEITQTKQFRELCPSTAYVMHRSLSGVERL